MNNNELLDDLYVEEAKQERIKKWKDKSWAKLMLVQLLLFGSGLFYIDKRLKRRWIYLIAALYAWLSFLNVFLKVFPELGRFHNRDFAGAMTIFAGWGIAYIIGSIDLSIALYLRKRGRI